MSTSWHLGVDVGSVHVKVVAIAPQGEHHSWVGRTGGKSLLDVITGLLKAEVSKTAGNEL